MQVHHYYGVKVIIVWDNLSAHYSAENYFEDEHPGWFEFEHFPSHSPELNPVESCWNHGKDVYFPNFVPTSDEELVQVVDDTMQRINEDHLLPSFFKHAGLEL